MFIKRILPIVVVFIIILQLFTPNFVIAESTHSDSYAGTLDSCLIDQNKENLVLNGTIFPSNIEDADKIDVYELPIFADEKTTDYLLKTPNSSIKVTNGESYPDFSIDGNKVVLGDFENSYTDGWVVGSNVDTAQSVTHNIINNNDSPAVAAHGNYFLQVKRKAIPVTTSSYIAKNLSKPIDLTNRPLISFDLYGWSGTAQSYVVEVIIHSGNINNTYEKTITADKWQNIKCDISNFSNISSVTSISIGYRGVNSTIGNDDWNGAFSIDYVTADAPVSHYVGISNFEDNTTDGWVSGANTDASSVRCVSTFADPTKAAEGTYYLVAQKNAATSSDTISYITKNFQTPLNLSGCSNLNFEFFGWGIGPNYTFKVLLELNSGSIAKKYEFEYLNGWKTLSCDISDFAQRNNITSIKIGYADASNHPISSWNGHFFIDNVRAYKNIDDSMDIPDSISIGDFEGGNTNGWIAGNNAGIPKSVTTDIYGGGVSPKNAAQGTYFLQVQRNGVPVTTTGYTIKNFSPVLDLSKNKLLSFDFFGWGGVATSYIAEVKITSQTGSAVYEYLVTDGIWQNITCDISSLKGINKITSIAIGYKGVNSTIGTSPWNGSFAIDNIRGISTPQEEIKESKKITLEDFEHAGDTNGWILGDNTGRIGVQNGGFNISGKFPTSAYKGNYCLSAQKSGVDPIVPSYVQKKFQTPLDLSNYSQLGYAIAGWGGVSGIYSTELILTSTDGKIKVFPISIQANKWENVLIDISDVSWRNKISSIKIGYCAVDDQTYQNQFPTGVIWDGCFSIDDIYGVEDLSNSGVTINPNSGILSNGKYTMKISLDTLVDTYSKYVVVLTKKDGSKKLIDCAKYVTNNEMLATNTKEYPATKSIKGLTCLVLNSDAERVGVQYNNININLSGLFTLSNHGTESIPYFYEGQTYYFQKNIINHYDTTILSNTINGMHVYAIFILKPNPEYLASDDYPDKDLLYPEADEDDPKLNYQGVNYAPNVSNSKSVQYYKAIVSFISQRYSRIDDKYGHIKGYIIGNEIGNSTWWNNMGPQLSTQEYVKRYEWQLRLTDAIVKQAWSKARVFVSFDCLWNVTYPGSAAAYVSKDIVELLNQMTTRQGNYDWGIAYHPYSLDAQKPWKDSQNGVFTVIDDFNTDYITFKNLQVLTRFMRKQEFLYDGTQRHIILSEQGFTSKNNTLAEQKIQAAAYAYAYYKCISTQGIDAFMLHRQLDMEDEGGLMLGIWTTKKGEIQVDQPKVIYNVFKDIDTVNSLNVTNFALGVIGQDLGQSITSWNQLIPEFSTDIVNQVCNRPVTATAPSGIPQEITDSIVMSSGSTDNWFNTDDTINMKLVDDTVKNKKVLSVNTSSNSSIKEFYGLTYTPDLPVDLTNRPIITVDVKAAGIGPGKKAEFMIKAYSGDAVIEGVYIGPAEQWNKVSLDISGWSGIASVDKIKIWARPENSVSWINYTGSSNWIYVDNLTVSKHTKVYNIDIKPDKQAATVGDVINFTITNKSNFDIINKEYTTKGINGLVIDNPSNTVSILKGNSITFPVTIKGIDIMPRRYGSVDVTIDGITISVPLTELFFPDYYKDGDDLLFSNFEEAMSDGWIAGVNTMDAMSVTSDSVSHKSPAQAAEGTYCLETIKTIKPATTKSYIVRRFKDPLDLNKNSLLKFDFYGWGGTSDDYAIELTLTSKDGYMESYYLWYDVSNDWKAITFDISKFKGIKNVLSISIGYYGMDKNIHKGNWNGRFFIDDIRAKPGTSSDSGNIDNKPDDSVSIASIYKPITDRNTGVSIQGIALTSNLQLTVNKIDDQESDIYSKLRELVTDNYDVKIVSVYEIGLILDDAIYEPSGNVKIAIPKPSGYSNNSVFYIAHLKAEDTIEYLETALINGNLVFEADSTSYFSILYAGTNKNTNSPDTGGPINGSLILMSVIASGFVILSVMRKKKTAVRKA